MIPIASPDIGEQEKKAVLEVLDSGIIAAGPKVSQFEKEFAQYTGVKHAIAVSSGTAALHVALLANGIGPGDEVITTPFTFIASANSVLFTGATPVFADIKEDTYNIDPEQIAEKITKKTKAILPVHLYGHPADMKAIMEIAADHKLTVIEDACQAHGASQDGKKVGSFATGCFSFYPTKNMTTSEGGMITTDDDEVDKLSRAIRQHGMMRRYYHDILGYNFRLTDIAAAIGIQQLKKLPQYNKKRAENAIYYGKNIKNRDITLPIVAKGCVHAFHQYTIRHPSRDNLTQVLEKAQIGYGVYYPVPINQQKHFLDRGYKVSCPISEKMAREVVSIPVHPKLTQENLQYITDTLNKIR